MGLCRIRLRRFPSVVFVAILAVWASGLGATACGGGGGDDTDGCTGVSCVASDAGIDGPFTTRTPDAAPRDGGPADAAGPDAAVSSLCEGDSAGTFPGAWISGGPACGSEPSIQVHRYNTNTFILRQSLCTSFEAPFLYLLFGEDKVLLEDTGDGGIPIRETVDSLIDQVLTERGQESIELVVVNSHAHGDHAGGNGEFADRPNTTVVGLGIQAVGSFFGFQIWPADPLPYDLGGRIIDVAPIPGHQSSHIALYDRQSGLLLTGDTLYPGRLYISDFAAYRASIRRLVTLTEGREVCAVLGTHIEMTQVAGQDFAFQSTHHPDEHALALPRSVLMELSGALEAMSAPAYQAHSDFIIYPL